MTAYAPSHGLYVCACAANLDQLCVKGHIIVMCVRSAAAIILSHTLPRTSAWECTTTMLTVQESMCTRPCLRMGV